MAGWAEFCYKCPFVRLKRKSIYLLEGGKPTDLPVFEIRAAHRSRTISFFFLGEMLGRGGR
jgi:hypothetical protein